MCTLTYFFAVDRQIEGPETAADVSSLATLIEPVSKTTDVSKHEEALIPESTDSNEIKQDNCAVQMSVSGGTDLLGSPMSTLDQRLQDIMQAIDGKVIIYK